jgi:rhamnosyltransferase
MPEPENHATSLLPRVTVLLATFNGERFLDEQLDSILNQQGIELRVVARDDRSSDNTLEILTERAAQDPRLTILATDVATGGSAANFYRLLSNIDLSTGGFIAFADQDDIWMPDKLARHAALLLDGVHDGVSSNVTSFSADRPRSLVRKDYPQRDLDFLLESPGPGCSFLLSPRLATLVQERLRDDSSKASSAHFHDWLIYALCRGAGLAWHIDSVSSVDYRQHANNTMGANRGWRAATTRLRLLAQPWHREQATLLCEVAGEVAGDALRVELSEVLKDLSGRGVARRFSLFLRAPQLRRRPRDRAIIGILVALGIW